jgi:putative nucleotidyltransferase with HDIG domain
MNRESSLTLLKENLKDDYTLKHSLALEAIMRKLAQKFNEDVEEWGITGLLHDIDWDSTKTNIEKHSLLGAALLEQKGYPKRIVDAVRAHNESHGLSEDTLLAKFLSSADNLTGLITACALVHPEKNLASVKPSSVLKKFKDKSFAAGTSREKIARCDQFGIPLADSIAIALEAMQEIHEQLGL